MEYQLEFSTAKPQAPVIRGQPDDEAIRMIQAFEGIALEHDPRGYCVCTSEGKDSRVLGHLMRRAGVKHFYLHSITGIDPPELVYFQRRNFQQYRDAGYLTYDVPYEKSIWELMLKKLVPPFRHMRYCCQYLKERRGKEQAQALLSLGVRKYESVNRAKNRDELEIAMHGKSGKSLLMTWDNDDNRRTFETCYAQNEKRLNPLAYWPDSLIWDYSKDAKLEQCSLYHEGFARLGCIGCPMAREKGRRREFARWPGFERLWLQSFERLRLLRIERGLINIFATGREWFDWWMLDKAQESIDEDQLWIAGYEI